MNENLTKAGTLLAKKVQFLLDHDKIGEKQTDDYNKIIDLMIQASRDHDKIVQFHTDNEINATLKYMYLSEKCILLEAICLQHGILDLSYLLNKPGIITEAKKALETKEFQLPIIFLRKQNITAVSDVLNFHKNSL